MMYQILAAVSIGFLFGSKPTDPNRKPVLELVSCSCAPSISVLQWPSNPIPQCSSSGTPVSCFSAVATKIGTDDDVPGTCYIAPVEGNPSACPNTATPCIYVSRLVTVQAAGCATSGGCGSGPWQLHNIEGQPVGTKFTNDDVRTSTVSPGNKSCGAIPATNYDLPIKDSNAPAPNVITTIRLEVKCANCTG